MVKKQLEKNERERIIKLRNKGLTLEDISNIYDINISTVQRIIKKYNKMNNLDRKSGTGIVTRYSTEVIKNALSVILTENRGLSLLEIKHKLKIDHNINYSKSTLSNILKNLSYSKKNANLKLPLTEENLNDRENWCIFYNNFKNWNKIIWTDEAKICNDHEKQKIWIKEGENVFRYKYKYPLKINIWCAMIENKKLIFKIFDKTLNSEKYLKILEEKILPLYEEDNTYIYQQDNAPCHTSYKTIKFFGDNQIEVMFWPPNSPDLSPIENVWNLIKNETRKKYYKNKDEMILEIENIMNNFSIDIINKLTSSMNNRIEQLFSNNFDKINY